MPLEKISILTFCAVALATILMWYGNRKNRSRSTYDPFPAHWKDIVWDKIPITRSLPLYLKRRHQQQVLDFLKEKTFVGQGGFIVTEEIKIIIAAQACLLTIGRSGPLYPLLDTLHVFEGAFEGHLVIGDDVELDIDHGHVVGLTWASGPVALSWNHSERGAIDPIDGHNVVFHEFAHQLDMESGFIDGIPVMGDADAFAVWSKVMQREHSRLKTSIAMAKDRGEDPAKASLINPYGANGLEEFFAVSTEVFFENPGPLKVSHPDLYDQFKAYYRLDPAQWRR